MIEERKIIIYNLAKIGIVVKYIAAAIAPKNPKLMESIAIYTLFLNTLDRIHAVKIIICNPNHYILSTSYNEKCKLTGLKINML